MTSTTCDEVLIIMCLLLMSHSYNISKDCRYLYDYIHRIYDYNRQYICENNLANISCESGLIEILHANYGRTNSKECYCNWKCVTNCTEPSSILEVKKRCENKSSCAFWASNNIFGDPCWRTPKYLNVSYRCSESKTTAAKAVTSEAISLYPHDGSSTDFMSIPYSDSRTTTFPYDYTVAGSSALSNYTSSQQKASFSVPPTISNSSKNNDDKLVSMVAGIVSGSIAFIVGIAIFVFVICMKRGLLRECLNKQEKQGSTNKATFTNTVYDREPNINVMLGVGSGKNQNVHCRNVCNNNTVLSGSNEIENDTKIKQLPKPGQEAGNYSFRRRDNDTIYNEGKYGEYDYLGKSDERHKDDIDNNIYDHTNISTGKDPIYDISGNFKYKYQNDEISTYSHTGGF